MEAKMAVAIALIVICLVSVFAVVTFWREEFEDLTGIDFGFGSENYAGISLTVEYKDGTTKTFKQEKSLLPLTISDVGGEVTAITASVSIVATHDAPSTKGWGVDGSWSVKIFQGATEIAEMGDPDLGTKMYSHDATTNFVSGEKYTINSGTIRYGSEQVEDALANEGDYTMTFETTLKLWLSFPDNTLDEKTGTAKANWDFTYSSSYGIESLSVSIYNGKVR